MQHTHHLDSQINAAQIYHQWRHGGTVVSAHVCQTAARLNPWLKFHGLEQQCQTNWCVGNIT